MPKKVNDRPPEPEPPKLPKKKGRPRKHPLPVEVVPISVTREDDLMISKYLRQAIAGRRIESWLELYEQRGQLVRYILDSYRFGELGRLTKEPDRAYLEDKIVRCFRDMH